VDKATGDAEQRGSEGTHASIIEHARGVLVLALRTSPGIALGNLTSVAERHDKTLEAIAHAVVTAASGAKVADAHMRTILGQEWGDLLQ